MIFLRYTVLAIQEHPLHTQILATFPRVHPTKSVDEAAALQSADLNGFYLFRKGYSICMADRREKKGK